MPETEYNETNIGILVVHGIGDQKQFDCLREIANDIVEYFQSEIDKGYVEVSVDINQADIGTFKETYPSWENGKKPPINVRIRPTGYEKNYNLHLREVWWADIDRYQEKFKFSKFWLWGLSLWATPLEKNFPILNDPDKHLQQLTWVEKDENCSRIWARCEYFLIGVFLLVCQPLLFLIKTLLRFFDFNVPLTIIADYVGKLRLYQDSSKAAKELIEDRGNSPRFSIQRRMINALVRMAISDYDRWYVWSHSLGSIVAYNAFSMPEATLSHYVSHAMWKEIQDCKRRDSKKYAEILLDQITPANQNNQRPKPYRPVWQDKRISRKALFEKCEGLITYGSPFWRIADLWTDLVKRNPQADFSPDFKWFNIIDPSDPVATRIKELFIGDPPAQGQPQFLYPEDIFYRTPKSFLLAHMEYLSAKKENSLIGQLWRWMSEARNITEQNNELYNSWYVKLFIRFPGIQDEREAYLRYHQIWRFIWWIFLIFVFYLILDAISLFLCNLKDLFSPSFISIFTSILERLATYFFDEYWSNSIFYQLGDLVDQLIGSLISLIFQLINQIRPLVDFINLLTQVALYFVSILKPLLIDFINSLIHLGLYLIHPFVLSTVFITSITSNVISSIFPSPQLFLMLIGLVIVLGLIRRIRGNPIKFYILEYLQNHPNQHFKKDVLTKEKFQGAIKEKAFSKILNKLVEEREIRKDASTREYFFPFYDFDWSVALKSLPNTNEIQRSIIDKLKFNPDEEITGRNTYIKEENIYYVLIEIEKIKLVFPYEIHTIDGGKKIIFVRVAD